VDIPGRVGHDYIEFAQDLEVKVSQIAVNPLCVRHPLSINSLFLRNLNLLVLFDVMNQLAVRIMTGIEMRAVPEAFVSILVYDGSKMFLIAVGVTFCLLALIPGAVVAVLQILLGLEVQSLNFF
jgi:hypothetical protein